MNLTTTISAAVLALAVSAAVSAEEPAIAERPLHRVSAIAIIAPSPSTSNEPRILLLDLYPNKMDSCTDIIVRGWYCPEDVFLHREKDGWRFESKRLAAFAPRILLFSERADGNGYRWVGERRLRADGEIEAELP